MSKDSRRWVFSKPGKRFYEWKIAMGQDPASHTGLMSRVVRTSAPAQRPRVACLLILLKFPMRYTPHLQAVAADTAVQRAICLGGQAAVSASTAPPC
jgi:hypothetical protein